MLFLLFRGSNSKILCFIYHFEIAFFFLDGSSNFSRENDTCPKYFFLNCLSFKKILRFYQSKIYTTVLIRSDLLFFSQVNFFGKFTSMSENKKRKSLGESNFHCKKQEVPKQTKFVYNPTQVLVVFIYTKTKNIAPKNSWWWC